jgi:hypothetical protein
MTLAELALRMRCSLCGKKAARVVAVVKRRPRGVPKNLPESSALQLQLDQQLLALFLPLPARGREHRIVAGGVYPLLELQKAPELFSVTYGAIDQKRMVVSGGCRAFWKRMCGHGPCRLVPHPDLPRSGCIRL